MNSVARLDLLRILLRVLLQLQATWLLVLRMFWRFNSPIRARAPEACALFSRRLYFQQSSATQATTRVCAATHAQHDPQHKQQQGLEMGDGLAVGGY